MPADTQKNTPAPPTDTQTNASASPTGTYKNAPAPPTGTQKNAPTLLSVYLFHGDDELKRDTMLKRLTDRIAESGDLLLNRQVMNSEDIKDPDQLLDALITPPFAGLYRLVVIYNSEKFDKTLQDTIATYLKSPTETTVLALVANKLSSKAQLLQAVQSYNAKSIINVSSIRRSELPQHLSGLAQDYQITLHYQAAQSLIGRVGTSMTALNNELKRLAAWAVAAGRRELTVADIYEQVPALVEPTPWEFADALCLRDIALVLRMRSEMHSSQATAIFTFSVARLREVLSIISLRQRGITSATQIANQLGSNKKEWQIRSSLAAASRFNETELTEILRLAQQSEAAMKSGADAEQVLTLWLVDVCSKKAAPQV